LTTRRICTDVAEFLTTVPPGEEAEITTCLSTDRPALLGQPGFAPDWLELQLPRIRLYCRSQDCQGERFFSFVGNANKVHRSDRWTQLFLWYRCNDCKQTEKAFAIRVLPMKYPAAAAMKYGEEPSFGPPLPSKLLTLLRESEDLLSRGRRCENQGMGIGAFVYYRRVLDNQRLKILDQLINVAERLRADAALVGELKAAKTETQFSNSLGKIKHALPPALLIKDHNPLTLLHDALSKGVHELTDDECLQRATAIRVLLTSLAARIDELMRDDAELEKALTQLVSKRTEN
jgi:hypothetical protein